MFETTNNDILNQIPEYNILTEFKKYCLDLLIEEIYEKYPALFVNENCYENILDNNEAQILYDKCLYQIVYTNLIEYIDFYVDSEKVTNVIFKIY